MIVKYHEYSRIRNIVLDNLDNITNPQAGTVTTNNITASYITIGTSSVFNGSIIISGNQQITGSSFLSGSSYFTGSFFSSGSNYFIGNTQVTGNFVTSGSQTVTGSLYVSGSSYFTGSTNISGNYYLTGNLNISGSIIPNQNNLHSLGSQNYIWKNIYGDYLTSSSGLSSSLGLFTTVTASNLSSSLGFFTTITSSFISSSLYYGNELTSSLGISSSIGLLTRVTSSFISSSVYYGNQLTSSIGLSSSLGLFTTVTASFISSSTAYTTQLTSSFISASIYSGSNLHITTDTKFGTNINLDANKGIKFNNGLSAGGLSELFDDYEYGTWTPAQGGTGWSTNLVTMTGNYIKIGKMVNVWVTIDANTADTLSSSYTSTITNLPFTVNGVVAAHTTTYTSLPIDAEIYPCRAYSTTIKIDKNSTALFSSYYIFASYLT